MVSEVDQFRELVVCRPENTSLRMYFPSAGALAAAAVVSSIRQQPQRLFQIAQERKLILMNKKENRSTYMTAESLRNGNRFLFITLQATTFKRRHHTVAIGEMSCFIGIVCMHEASKFLESGFDLAMQEEKCFSAMHFLLSKSLHISSFACHCCKCMCV